MGYTNYWDIEKKFKAKKAATFDKAMLGLMKRVVTAYNKKHKAKLEYKLDDKHVELFGDGATSETLNFVLTKDPKYGRLGIDSWLFCKTNREPYDAVVKVFLNLLQYFGVIHRWAHDDNIVSKIYRDAAHFAEEVFTDDEFKRNKFHVRSKYGNLYRLSSWIFVERERYDDYPVAVVA